MNRDRVFPGAGRVAVLSALVMSTLPGCGVTGTWRTIGTEPQASAAASVGAAAPAGAGLTAITFAKGARYTATESVDSERNTVLGRYRFDGFRLTLTPDSDGEDVYRVRRGWDGRLILVRSRDGRRVVLEKIKAPEG